MLAILFFLQPLLHLIEQHLQIVIRITFRMILDKIDTRALATVPNSV
jgi:hypothetical protein